MIRFAILRNSEEQLRSREKKYSEIMADKVKKYKIPEFDYGLKELFLKPNEKPLETLLNFVDEWNSDLEKKLNYKNFKSPKVIKKKDIIQFPSILNSEDTANFKFTQQPKWRAGSKIAVIILKHWNAESKRYSLGVDWIRRMITPTSTAIFLPSYQDLNPQTNRNPQYSTLGPNIGLTIKRVWQDVLDVQYFANYLKEEMGFNQIGLFTYSIGSLRGFLASIFAPKLFDFAIFHYLVNDFSEAVLTGLSTQDIAKVIKKNISEKDLQKIWSVISPGNYTKHLNRLPKATRLVQGKYDLVLGEENCNKITKKIRKFAPFVEIEEGNFGHLTVIEMDKAAPMMIRNLKFIYKNSDLKYF